ncbi:hypothetical protein L2725_03165 [Shewanella corallii]|uniref:Uncharacterized protein n=1 Tax=Shewanella corallii TaxID=560080 RepID=A0ABT0N2W9_9GAMM|nr:hypothetical protein [Shewanella corallii]MCL2912792.1 hypothetical protein [Shewanella corallii]
MKPSKLPSEILPLKYQAQYSNAEAAKIRAGLEPTDMEDKWRIFADGDWVYFQRSWTGYLIFALKLESTPTGMRVVESWVNANPDEYNSQGREQDIAMLDKLITYKFGVESAR